jgi:hypothetical protein
LARACAKYEAAAALLMEGLDAEYLTILASGQELLADGSQILRAAGVTLYCKPMLGSRVASTRLSRCLRTRLAARAYGRARRASRRLGH